jgi:hypothetical protein
MNPGFKFVATLVALFSIAFALPVAAEYTLVEVRNNKATTSCVTDPRIKPGASITIYKHGRRDWAPSVTGKAAASHCTRWQLENSSVGDGYYLGVWSWDAPEAKQVSESKRLSYLDRKAEQKKLDGLARKDPKFRLKMKEKTLIAFAHQGKVMGAIQYGFGDRSGNRETGLFFARLKPHPAIVSSSAKKGPIGKVATHYTFDVIDDNGDGEPELAMLSGIQVKNRFAGYITIYSICELGTFTKVRSSLVKF